MRLVKLRLAVILTAACSSGAGQPDSQAPVEAGAEDRLPPGVAWRLSEPRPLSQPLIIDGTAVVLGHRDAELVVFGVAVDTGELLWEKRTSRGDVLSGISVVPVLLESTVLHFAPDPDDSELASLVALDSDGEERWRSEPLAFSVPPERCFDGRDVCIDASTDDGEVTLRFDLDSGEARPDRAVPEGARPLAALGLVDLGERDPEFLARVGTDGPRWKTPLAEAFSAQHSTDYGWHFELFPDAAAFVGSVGPVIEPPEEGDVARVPLDTAATAGIDAESGRVLWRDAGSQFLCFGSVNPADDDTQQDEHLLPLRCRYRGTGVFSNDGDTSFENLGITLERFDPATGATRWALPLAASESLAIGEEQPPVFSDSSILVPTPDGVAVVDLDSGKSEPPAPGQMFWCWDDAMFSGPSNEVDADGEDYSAGRLYRLYDAERHEAVDVAVGVKAPGVEPQGARAARFAGGTLLESLDCRELRALRGRAAPGHDVDPPVHRRVQVVVATWPDDRLIEELETAGPVPDEVDLHRAGAGSGAGPAAGGLEALGAHHLPHGGHGLEEDTERLCAAGLDGVDPHPEDRALGRAFPGGSPRLIGDDHGTPRTGPETGRHGFARPGREISSAGRVVVGRGGGGGFGVVGVGAGEVARVASWIAQAPALGRGCM